MIIIEYLNYVKSVGQKLARDSHPWYDLVSKLPPLLQNCEGFEGIQIDLKAMTAQEKTPASDYQQPLPNMELLCCDECLAWIQIYYIDISYFHMCLNQTLVKNRNLERENWDLKVEEQETLPRENKRFKKSGDIVIKNSTNMNVVMSLDMYEASFSNV